MNYNEGFMIIRRIVDITNRLDNHTNNGGKTCGFISINYIYKSFLLLNLSNLSHDLVVVRK